MIRKIWTIVLAVLLVNSATMWGGEVALDGAEVGKWTMDYQAAVNLAKEKKLPLLLNFTGSDWCSWCILMERNVFSKTQWQNYAKENVVMVTLDFPKNTSKVPQKYAQRNYDLQAKFGVQGYPTFIILDEDGETVIGQLGAARNPSPEWFIDQLEGITMFRESALERKAKSLSGEKVKAFSEVVSAYNSTISDFDNWLNTGPTKTEENIQIYQAFLNKIEALKSKIATF